MTSAGSVPSATPRRSSPLPEPRRTSTRRVCGSYRKRYRSPPKLTQAMPGARTSTGPGSFRQRIAPTSARMAGPTLPVSAPACPVITGARCCWSSSSVFTGTDMATSAATAAPVSTPPSRGRYLADHRTRPRLSQWIDLACFYDDGPARPQFSGAQEAYIFDKPSCGFQAWNCKYRLPLSNRLCFQAGTGHDGAQSVRPNLEDRHHARPPARCHDDAQGTAAAGSSVVGLSHLSVLLRPMAGPERGAVRQQVAPAGTLKASTPRASRSSRSSGASNRYSQR